MKIWIVVLLLLGVFVGCHQKNANSCPRAPTSQTELDRLIAEIDAFLKAKCNSCTTPPQDRLCAEVCEKVGKRPVLGPMPWEGAGQ